MSKADRVAAHLQSRIHHGDYELRGLPPERELAEQFEVSRMTARKALLQLVERGLLRRGANGRLHVVGQTREQPRIAFLTPSITSASVEHWRLMIGAVAEERALPVRLLMYRHWQDATLPETLEAFDAVFFYAAAEPMPDRIAERLRTRDSRIVALERDFSGLGLPSLPLLPLTAPQRLLDEFHALGHRRIDCFNVQPTDPIIDGRIEQWNVWRAAKSLPGKLHGDPRSGSTLPIERARQQMGEMLDTGVALGTALLCITVPAAIGAARALADRGLRPGEDLSIAAVNDEGLGRYLVPSITSLLPPEPIDQLRVCLDWFTASDAVWPGPLCMTPPTPELFPGETVKPPRSESRGAPSPVPLTASEPRHDHP